MINNPYEVLGVSPSASDDENKKKHIVILQESIIRMRMLIILLQILQKKKFKEVQEAYDMIMKRESFGRRIFLWLRVVLGQFFLWCGR